MNKNFALLSILAFAEAVKLDCMASCGVSVCDDRDDEHDNELIDQMIGAPRMAYI